MSEEILVSATQISTWRDVCQRKWAFRSIEKIEQEQTKAAALGTEVDDTQLQPYFRDRREFDYSRESGYIAASILAYLPSPETPGLEVQKKFVLTSPSWERFPVPLGFLGYKDLWVPDSRALPGIEPHPSGPIPAVVDFKTTSDFRWAKTAEDLRTDPQAQIYAMNALVETGAPAVDLVWLYMRTRGARASKRVHLRVHREEVAQEFAKLDAIACEIAEARMRVKSALELPPNPDGCGAFGGCPYKSRCYPDLSPIRIQEAYAALAAKKEGDPMASTVDLLAGLRNKAGITPAPVAPVAVAPVAPSPPPLAVSPAPSVINPPEKALPPAPPINVAPPAPAPAEAEKPKRGRPAGSKNKPTVSFPAVTGETSTDYVPELVDVETFEVTWGEESFTVSEGVVCKVGPFKATGATQPGESLGDAMRRVSAVLYGFAIEERANKLASFGRNVGAS